MSFFSEQQLEKLEQMKNRYFSFMSSYKERNETNVAELRKLCDELNEYLPQQADVTDKLNALYNLYYLDKISSCEAEKELKDLCKELYELHAFVPDNFNTVLSKAVDVQQVWLVKKKEVYAMNVLERAEFIKTEHDPSKKRFAQTIQDYVLEKTSILRGVYAAKEFSEQCNIFAEIITAKKTQTEPLEISLAAERLQLLRYAMQDTIRSEAEAISKSNDSYEGQIINMIALLEETQQQLFSAIHRKKPRELIQTIHLCIEIAMQSYKKFVISKANKVDDITDQIYAAAAEYLQGFIDDLRNSEAATHKVTAKLITQEIAIIETQQKYADFTRFMQINFNNKININTWNNLVDILVAAIEQFVHLGTILDESQHNYAADNFSSFCKSIIDLNLLASSDSKPSSILNNLKNLNRSHLVKVMAALNVIETDTISKMLIAPEAEAKEHLNQIKDLFRVIREVHVLYLQPPITTQELQKYTDQHLNHRNNRDVDSPNRGIASLINNHDAKLRTNFELATDEANNFRRGYRNS